MGERRTARTATTKVVTDINRTAVLDALEQSGPASRSGLRERTGLSPATVDRLCAALLEDGLIERCGVEKSSGGRPSTLFRFAGERRVIVAAEVTTHGPRGMLVGLDGTGSDRLRRPLPVGAEADERLEATLATIASLIEQAGRDERRVLGLALSVPGVVDGEGRVSNSEELGWRRLAIGSIVEHRFGLPCLVENDANAIAVGEWTHGVGSGTESLAALVLGTGVGAGLVVGGRLIRGAHSGAGEIGYLLTGRESLRNLYAQQGDLESRIGQVTARHRGDRRALATAEVLRAAAAGDRRATDLTTELLDYLALSAAAVATVLDPEVIVFAGRLPDDEAHLLHHLLTGLEQRLTGRIPLVPRIVLSALGDDAALVGVGELMARRTKGAVYLA